MQISINIISLIEQILREGLSLRFTESPLRWLPLFALVTIAVLFEPIRSNFNLANQTCEIFPAIEQFAAAFLNKKDIKILIINLSLSFL